MIVGLLFYLLVGMCEAAIGLDGLIEGHLLGFIGYTIFWLPMDVWFTVQAVRGQGLRLRNSIGIDKGLRDNGEEQGWHSGLKGEAKQWQVLI